MILYQCTRTMNCFASPTDTRSAKVVSGWEKSLTDCKEMIRWRLGNLKSRLTRKPDKSSTRNQMSGNPTNPEFEQRNLFPGFSYNSLNAVRVVTVWCHGGSSWPLKPWELMRLRRRQVGCGAGSSP